MIVAMGEILWDILPTGKVLGGAPANFAHYCMHNGLKAHLLSAVGMDNLANLAQAQLESLGLGGDLLYLPYATGSVDVHVQENGEACYDFADNVAWDHLVLTPAWEALLGSARVFYFGTLAQRNACARACIQSSAQIVSRNPQNTVFFDANLRQDDCNPAIIRRSLELATILKVNTSELEKLQQTLVLPPDAILAARALIEEYRLELVILTCASLGSHVITQDAQYFADASPARFVDSIGAGDAYSAAFICARLQKLDIEEAMHRASCYAAHICEQHGAFLS